MLAIGNPFGLGGSVSAGILSARQRDIHSGPYDDYLQTDAAINRGNSGGPMFNMQGEVIGINTAIYSPSGGSIGIGFAIPSNIARDVATELISDPEHVVHRGWLGVRIQAVTDDVAETLGLDKPRGALVASVNENGPAQTGGIQPGDVILSFDGKPVNDMRHLPRVVAATKAGKTVPVTVWRKRQQETVQVAVGRLGRNRGGRPGDAPKDKPSKSESPTVTALGLTLSNITAELKDKFSLKDDKGVVVVDVAERQRGGPEGARTRRRDPGGLAAGDQKRRARSPRRSTKPSGPAAARSWCWSIARASCAFSRCASTRADAGADAAARKRVMTPQPGAISASR